jgi:hypothetical protein
MVSLLKGIRTMRRSTTLRNLLRLIELLLLGYQALRPTPKPAKTLGGLFVSEPLTRGYMGSGDNK